MRKSLASGNCRLLISQHDGSNGGHEGEYNETASGPSCPRTHGVADNLNLNFNVKRDGAIGGARG
jgi:hypothetical protein